MKDFSKLEQSLEIKFDDIDLLRQAMVHRSYINEHPSFSLKNNERLEFLGDAVLELAVTDSLFENYPDKPEGDLTNWRASLVNAKMLSEVASDLGINDYLYLSRGESKDTGKARRYILADAFEALIGAIYLDQGLEAARSFIKTNLLPKLPHILQYKLYLDSKTKFQEAAQDKAGITPSYKVLEESGPDHAKRFRIGVFLENELMAEGEGSSKQEAQTEAAAKALLEKGWD